MRGVYSVPLPMLPGACAAVPSWDLGSTRWQSRHGGVRQRDVLL